MQELWRIQHVRDHADEHRGKDFEAELDICSVVNGEIHAGEGKSNNSLKGDLTDRATASKLVRGPES